MIKVTCPTCTKSVELEDRYAGRRARCACGTPIQIPKDAPRDGRTATSAALEEAMRVADGKVQGRGEGGLGSAGKKLQLTKRQGYMLGGIAAAALVLTLAWSAVTPSSWESEHHDVLVTLKRDADALAAAGKARAASDKYGQVIRLVAGGNLRNAELKKLMQEAKAARGSLVTNSTHEQDAFSNFGSFIADGFDVGTILPAGLTLAQLQSDLTDQYSVSDNSNYVAANVAVPEPAALSLLGLSAVGFVARRRRRH